jgi:microcystin-dependent protein
MTFWKWSKTASSNSNADATINFAEGQAPSSLNDSGRALMAAAAKFRDDISGALAATTASANTYAVTTNQNLTSLTAGFEVAFVPDETNTGTSTLAVDGLTAKPLRNVQGTELGAGVLIANTIYRATYSTTNSGEWILHSSPSGVLPGSGMLWFTTTAPSGYVLLQGQAISRTTYATLFSMWTTQFGTGDGSTTFNVPNLIGRVPAGLDTSSTRLSSFTSLGATLGAQTKTILQANLPSVSLSAASLTANSSWTSLNSEVVTGGTSGEFSAGSGFSTYRSDTQTKVTPTGTVTTTIGGSVPLGGSGTALDITQPTLAVNFIVKY